MPTISVLPTHLVNKIAAGEVIERPASVVKELIENALDAGASRIEVAVEDGGRKSIRVADDGSGMDREDLSLALRPHATSKVHSDDDLYRVATLGFRGEALPSMASVAHVHIRTRPRDGAGGGDAAEGCELSADAGSIEPPRPCPAPPGTAVTVRDLFYNTPARRKFLRTANTELGHVSEQLSRLALPHPQVAFRLTHNRREVLNLPAARSTAQRASDLFGAELAESLLPVHAEDEAARVDGFVAPPAAARASGRWQYFFLNGRYVRDRALSHALREAYRGLLEPSRWPVAVVFLEVDPEEVDVNVHPTKIEVRFRNAQRVYGALLAGLKEALNKANLTAGASLERAGPPPGGEPDESAEARRQSLRQALADFFKSAPPPHPRLNFPEPPNQRAEGLERGEGRAAGQGLPLMRSAPSSAPPARREADATAESDAADESPQAQEPPPASSRAELPVPAPPAVQVHNTYIVAPCEEGLVIVDQHALHERVLYNDLHARLAKGGLAGQRMLLPETLRVTASEADLLDAQKPLLERLGIRVEPFGPQTVAIQQFPILLRRRSVPPQEFLRDLLDVLSDAGSAEQERLLESVVSVMACKAAVKAGDPLTVEEMQDLLARREQAEKSSACPHGRPTTLKLTLSDLERQFRRA